MMANPLHQWIEGAPEYVVVILRQNSEHHNNIRLEWYNINKYINYL